MASKVKSTTVKPDVLAVRLSASLKRAITGKAIRTLVRTGTVKGLERYGPGQRDGYTSHEYTAAQAAAITDAFTRRGQRSRAQAPAQAPVKRGTVRKARAQARAVKATPDATPES